MVYQAVEDGDEVIIQQGFAAAFAPAGVGDFGFEHLDEGSGIVVFFLPRFVALFLLDFVVPEEQFVVVLADLAGFVLFFVLADVFSSAGCDVAEDVCL